jgi:hypothetical protein
MEVTCIFNKKKKPFYTIILALSLGVLRSCFNCNNSSYSIFWPSSYKEIRRMGILFIPACLVYSNLW